MYRKMMGIESEQDARHGLPIRLGLLFAHHKEWTFSDIALSGSSDKTLRLWDLRVDKRIPPIDPSTTLRFFHPFPFQKKPFATANAERLSVP
jgi:WD40 repeat protein